MSNEIIFTLRPGDNILVKIEGRQGSVFVENPELGNPYVTLSLTDKPGYAEGFLFTRPKVVTQIEDLPSIVLAPTDLSTPQTLTVPLEQHFPKEANPKARPNGHYARKNRRG